FRPIGLRFVRRPFGAKKVPPPGADWQPEGGCSPQNNSEISGIGSERKKYLRLSVFLRLRFLRNDRALVTCAYKHS
ncbi:MAG: hypothetical protein ABI318_21160, partial [Chthoniobacteraceae bacterium]